MGRVDMVHQLFLQMFFAQWCWQHLKKKKKKNLNSPGSRIQKFSTEKTRTLLATIWTVSCMFCLCAWITAPKHCAEMSFASVSLPGCMHPLWLVWPLLSCPAALWLLSYSRWRLTGKGKLHMSHCMFIQSSSQWNTHLNYNT